MSQERRAQWAHRVTHLQALRDSYIRSGRYDRAHKAYLTIQWVYERWADEAFRAQHRPMQIAA
jgi:hypothetical protein